MQRGRVPSPSQWDASHLFSFFCCGLGDVVGELPKALARRGHRVMVLDPVVAPKYGNYAEPKGVGVLKKDSEVTYYLRPTLMVLTLTLSIVKVIKTCLILHSETFMQKAFTKMHRFYYHEPFASINSAKINYSFLVGLSLLIWLTFYLPKIFLFTYHSIVTRRRLPKLFQVPLHVPCGVRCGDGNLGFIANDWNTSLLPVYLKAYYREISLMKYAPSLFVIHNIAYQATAVSNFHHHIKCEINLIPERRL
ncbi:hypothetical protein C4D60_Mb01t27260 [Musa balbisiana]|uniref:Starch synthase catalytic domain-containing protein n=1 Tax=Musa balbisiana TaxID=52838 RepID=A0A4V4H7M8_MUSBA|nr:hypothetical protein C4D60_Mb01t27260 [Musa balbisiana]